MASSGKKGKKNKGTVISLQSFLSNGVGTPMGITQVAKKVRNLEADDSDDSSTTTTHVYQLPTAPRASRVLNDDTVPQKPPFLAFITNLPFDIQENDFQEIFVSVNIVSVRVPRDDGESGRIRGFGYVEFGSRDDLIHVLSLPDPQIKGRRIRIEVSNGNEPSTLRLKSNRRAYDGFGNICENRDSTNWRENSKNDDSHSITSKTLDRSLNRDANHRLDEIPMSWRSGSSSVHKSQVNNRNEETIYNERYTENTLQKVHENDALERPKLYLKPRSLPLPCSTKDSDIKLISQSNEISDRNTKVFGSARPVDTVAREREIDGRIIEVKRKVNIQQNQEQKNLHKNGNFSEVGCKDLNKSPSNCTITNWRFMENEADLATGRKEKQNLNDLSNESEAQEREDIQHLVNFNRIERSCSSNTNHEDDIKPKLNLKSEQNTVKFKIFQSESVIKSSNKYSELDEE